MERTRGAREGEGKGEEKRGSWLLKERVEDGEGWRKSSGKEVEADEEQGEESD